VTARALSKQERGAIEAVARHFSAVLEVSASSPHVYVTIAGKRIRVLVTTLRQRVAHPPANTKPRLRFDRVAVGLVGRLRAALSESVPDGETVIVTVTAPIWLASKTAATLEEAIPGFLADRSARARFTRTIHGNRVRVRVIKRGSSGASKVVGFVHNPDSDSSVLFDVTESLLACFDGAAIKRNPANPAGERWLVIAAKDVLPPIETYRQVYSQLHVRGDFSRILMVRPGGRIEILDGA
jgi:hypothetical protein